MRLRFLFQRLRLLKICRNKIFENFKAEVQGQFLVATRPFLYQEGQILIAFHNAVCTEINTEVLLLC